MQPAHFLFSFIFIVSLLFLLIARAFLHIAPASPLPPQHFTVLSVYLLFRSVRFRLLFRCFFILFHFPLAFTLVYTIIRLCSPLLFDFFLSQSQSAHAHQYFDIRQKCNRSSNDNFVTFFLRLIDNFDAHACTFRAIAIANQRFNSICCCDSI